jgi:[protein-PII] uridylyltransferase
MTNRTLIAQTIPGISPDEITAHFNLLPERYFIQTDAGGDRPAHPDGQPAAALHLERRLRRLAPPDHRMEGRPQPQLTVVNVVTWDRAGLFYKLAGAFSVAGLSILGAKVISRSDHIAIDTFYVVEPGRGVVQSQTAMETFRRTVEDALVSNKDLCPTSSRRPKNRGQAATTRPRARRHATPPSRRPSRSTTSSRCNAPSSRSRPTTRSACSTGWRRPSPTTASTSPSPASTPSAASPSTPSTSKTP